MDDRLSVREWQNAYNSGMYNGSDTETQIEAGWYDWFCNSYELSSRLNELAPIVLGVRDGGKIDLDNWYVWFKNNCPASDDPLYDDIRFGDLTTFENQYVIAVDDMRDSARYVVYSLINGYEPGVFATDDMYELIDWLNTP